MSRAMSQRTIATTVGILFVVQMVTAMAGTSLIQAFVDGDTAPAAAIGPPDLATTLSVQTNKPRRADVSTAADRVTQQHST
jgi:hypothetical protein